MNDVQWFNGSGSELKGNESREQISKTKSEEATE